ncbi:dUTP diphosphatase [Virgibacillus salarius]|uniref:dUTP diphosphatase n=1 Tax=Virgibacillus salarius TaxID=447199 RepID=UPI0031DEC1C2
MNLEKLFNMQKELDNHILERFPNLKNEDLLPKKILALQVELGELAQNWRGFKFWSSDQRPRGEDDYLEYRPVDQGGNHWVRQNPLLEEYVDCLHFILSIGLELGIKPENIIVEDDLTGATPIETFNELFSYVSAIHYYLDVNLPATITLQDIEEAFNNVFECFVGLGEEHLGFTWEQIEQAYLDKNKVNHERQANGY